MLMRLYVCSNSGHTYKVRRFLLLADIGHEYHFVGLKPAKPDRSPEFVAACRYGHAPVMLEVGRSGDPSNAILIGLARRRRRFACADGKWPRLLEWSFRETVWVGTSASNLRFAHGYDAQPEPMTDYPETLVRGNLAVEQVLDEREFRLPPGFGIADTSSAGDLYRLSDISVSGNGYPAHSDQVPGP